MHTYGNHDECAAPCFVMFRSDAYWKIFLIQYPNLKRRLILTIFVVRLNP
jgi:hypothetical protein